MKLRPLPPEAEVLCARLGAPALLIVHLRLVHDAAFRICRGLDKQLPELAYDRNVVLLGAAVHDVGKIEHPGELTGAGNLHEKSGEMRLLREGFSVQIAQIARCHGTLSMESNLIECFFVSLADKIWRGKRDEPFELKIAQMISKRLALPEWRIYSILDRILQKIAADADMRLCEAKRIYPQK